MAEKSLNEIPRPLRELYDKGSAALQRRNLDYAIAIFNQVLDTEPGLFKARESLRAAQFEKAKAGTGFFKKMMGTATNSHLLPRAQMLVRSNPVEAIALCEQLLDNDPSNNTAHKILAEAALEAHFPKTAVLSLEIVRKSSPRDEGVARRLGEALTESGNIQRAETVYQELLNAKPHDPEISQALKNLAARRTLNEQGYQELATGQGSYRDILKDKPTAVALEQEGRQIKAEDVTANLIRENLEKLAKDPNNFGLIRTIAQLYTERKDFDQALEYYQRIIAVEGAVDPSLEKLITDVQLRKLNHEYQSVDPAAPDFDEKRARLESERQAFQIADAKRRVDRYPNDLQLRFELGQIYLNAGRISEAIQEFQKAQNNPNRRIQAMSGLGQCFARRGMNDLAAKTFQNALKEKVGFDEERKELIYALGSVLEKMGRTDEAIEQFKHIYEVDIGYKNVAEKIDAYYAGK